MAACRNYRFWQKGRDLRDAVDWPEGRWALWFDNRLGDDTEGAMRKADDLQAFKYGTLRGFCRRYPPQPGTHPGHPVTQAAEWCGEWQDVAAG